LLWRTFLAITIVTTFSAMLFAPVVYCRVAPPAQVVEWAVTRMVPEREIAVPLIVGGERLVPEMCDRLKDKSQERRRYLIEAISQLRSFRAGESLSQLALDPSEPIWLREDALEALQRIDRVRWQSVINRLQVEPSPESTIEGVELRCCSLTDIFGLWD